MSASAALNSKGLDDLINAIAGDEVPEEEVEGEFEAEPEAETEDEE